MIITKNTSYKVLEIWFPKYSTQYGKEEELCLRPQCYKIDDAQARIIVCEITKARHLLGNKYCILRSKAMTYPRVKNGKSPYPVYEIPMSAFEPYETPKDILAAIDELWPS